MIERVNQGSLEMATLQQVAQQCDRGYFSGKRTMKVNPAQRKNIQVFSHRRPAFAAAAGSECPSSPLSRYSLCHA